MLFAANMSWGQSVVLGLLQGLTEFLPVSSTAHMALASRLLYGQDAGAAFSAVVQLGPIVAILWYFRTDLARYIQGVLRTRSPGRAVTENDLDARLGWYTLFGTVPLAIFGVLLEHRIDTDFRRPSVMGVFLIVLALIMLLAEKMGRRDKSLEKLTFEDSQVIGWAQVLALVPGASRSGVTITAGLFRGLDRESATRFSFLLSIPAITAAGLYKLGKEIHLHHLGSDVARYLFAALVAGVFAYVVIRWFLDYMKEHNTNLFIAYRIVLGIVLLGLVASHRISDAPPKEDDPHKQHIQATAPAASTLLPKPTSETQRWTAIF